MPQTVCPDELDHVTAGTAMLAVVFDEASQQCDGDVYPAGDAEDDLRHLLPGLLAQLPADALDLLGHHLRHVEHLVAFAHRTRALLDAIPEA